MPGIFKFIVKKCAVQLFIITFFSISVYGQTPPSQQNLQQLLPTLDPTQMSKTGFDSYFRDNNKSQSRAGADRSKENTAIINRVQNKTLQKDSTQIDNVKKGFYSIDQTYGTNVFQNSVTYDIAELSTPPLDYPIGVGDHIVVALWGGGEYQEDYVVARDGAIFPNSLGKITVQGLTFEMARSLIYARFKSVVPTGTNIQITLGQPRTINVNVGGEVENPGPVTVSAFSNAYNIIGLAGGITEFGNLRDIQVKRNGKIIESIDVYKYLASGEMESRIYLQNNDFVFVNNDVKKVFATGQFKRPMYYQLKKDEGIKALITFSGGFTPEAFTSGIKVIRTENEDQVIHDVNATAIIKLKDLDYPLLDGDIIKADLVKAGIINKLEIKGPVKYPGMYEIRKNDRLFDVINRAGGITKNTYLARAYIFRGAGDSTNIKSDKLEVDLTDIQNDNAASTSNVLLMPNDIIQLFASSEFGDQQFVDIFGEVRKEGKYRKYGGMTLQDLLYLAGGLKQSAEYGRLEISSVIDIDSAKQGLKPTRNIMRSFAINPDFQLDSVAATIVLKPYDQIFVRKNSSFDLQQNVQLLGLVRYAGYYPRLDRNERLSSYINRAGGTLPNANISGAVLYRKKVDFYREKIVYKPKTDSLGNIIQDSSILNLDEPVSIDLYNALKYPNTEHDIILQQNDILYVPEINPFITVQGTVQSPLKVTFDSEHTDMNYYIDKAGGFGPRPWKKRIFVTYANGRSKRTNTFLAIHFYPKVKEGSTVTVPQRPPSKDFTNILTLVITIALPILLTYLIIGK
jgi:protein involved in polysaccharide export with SLBB domain